MDSNQKYEMVFDEELYLLINPDVQRDVKNGIYASGYDHFKNFGYKENRIHCLPKDFDEEFYIARYPDIYEAVRKKQFAKGKVHYALFGYKENRSFCLPSKMFNDNIYLYPYSSVKNSLNHEFADPSLDLDKDIEIIKRIAKSYKLAKKDEPSDFRNDKKGMWFALSSLQNELLECIEECKYEEAAKILSNMFQTNITYGIAMGLTSAYMAKHAPDEFYKLWADRLLRFAEALGIITARSPEQSRYDKELSLDAENIISSAQELLGIEIKHPQIGGCFGIKVNNCIFPDICFSHLLVAVHAKALISKESSVMELGGGYGGLCYWLNLLGINDYTICDLPNVNIIQSYFLIKSLPNKNITLYGEKESKNNIKILPYWVLDDINDKKFKLTINQDSLPEMSNSIAAYYLKTISNITSDYFLSINQEAEALNYLAGRQNIVFSLVHETGGYKRISRNMFWGRGGYVEELYKITTD